MVVSEWKRLQTETGVSGLSDLCSLYDLYRFDPVQDMVIDRMHLTFNMLKRELIGSDVGGYGRKLREICQYQGSC